MTETKKDNWFLKTSVQFKGINNLIEFFIIPSLSRSLYLGILQSITLFLSFCN